MELMRSLILKRWVDMAKVRHNEIIPECNIDTNLVETLLKMINLENSNYDDYIVQHSHGIGEVTRTMQTAKSLKDGFAIGIVDDDPKVPNYKKEFQEVAQSPHLRLLKHPEKEHYLLVVSKAMESLINASAREQKINPSDYGFPENTKDYKKTTKEDSSRTNPNYKNLFKKLSREGEICLMKNILGKLVNEREGLSNADLNKIFKDAGY